MPFRQNEAPSWQEEVGLAKDNGNNNSTNNSHNTIEQSQHNWHVGMIRRTFFFSIFAFSILLVWRQSLSKLGAFQEKKSKQTDGCKKFQKFQCMQVGT